jgi:hypothetical protein
VWSEPQAASRGSTRADGGRGEVGPVRDPFAGSPVEEQPVGERATRRQVRAEYRGQQAVAGQHGRASAEQQRGDVVEGGEQPQQARVGLLRCLPGGPTGPAWGGGGEVAQVGTLGVVEPQGAGEGVEDVVGQDGLAALLDAAVVVGTEPGEHRELLLAQPRHPSWPGERRDAGLSGSDPVPAGAQERPEGGTVCWHVPSLGRCGPPWLGTR